MRAITQQEARRIIFCRISPQLGRSMRAIELEICGWRIGSARSMHRPAEVIVCTSNASLCMKQTLALRILDPSESATRIIMSIADRVEMNTIHACNEIDLLNLKRITLFQLRRRGNGCREYGLSLAICGEGSVFYSHPVNTWLSMSTIRLFLMLQIGYPNKFESCNVSATCRNMGLNNHPCHSDRDRSMTPPSSLAS